MIEARAKLGTSGRGDDIVCMTEEEVQEDSMTSVGMRSLSGAPQHQICNYHMATPKCPAEHTKREIASISCFKLELKLQCFYMNLHM